MTEGQRELMTVAEAATELRISRDGCYDLVRRGKLPHVRIGRAIRIPRAQLARWVETNIVGGGFDDRGRS